MSAPDASAAAQPRKDDEQNDIPEIPLCVDHDKIDRGSSIADSSDFAPHHGPVTMTGHLSLDDVEPVEVRLQDLSVVLDTSPSVWDPSTYPELLRQYFGKAQGGPTTKTLLSGVGASLQPGTLTAILGGSGSGKTTLLNTMAERVFSTRLSQTGVTTFNGAATSIESVRHAYVMQQDILLPTLTVRETLRYAANLRLPPPCKEEERLRLVEEVILQLGLKQAADTRIGNSQHGGCSGGERRRTSVGVQLLLLFLDEPTSGLDSTSAYQVVRLLKALSLKGRSIICTLHQPRSEIWELFDNLLLLSKGSLVYSGPMRECLPWFASLGFDIPPFVNPAEFVLDLISIDNRTPELEAASAARVEILRTTWAQKAGQMSPLAPLQRTTSQARQVKLTKQSRHAGFFRQIRVLTDRTFKVTVRDPMGMLGSILEALVMAIVTGYIFYHVGRDLAGIRSRQGALYTAVALQGYLSMMFETYRLTIDMAVFDRENIEGCVTPLPFILSRRFARFFTEDVPVPFIFSAIFYFMVGFDNNPAKFFIFFGVVLLNHYIAVTLAMTTVTAVRHFPGASLIGNLAYTLQSLACGYFIQSATIPVYVRWLKWITYTFYAFGALCGGEFEGSFYDCPYEGGKSNPACISYDGAYIMESLGLPQNWTTKPILAMLVFVILFMVLPWIGLTIVRAEMTIARARTTTDFSAGKEKMTARSIHEVRAVNVGLEKFALAVNKKSPLGRRLPTKVILNEITTTFHAGELNVIMGPSGSGKTSLLNAMARRLKNSVGTQYRPSGTMTFNGSVPSETVVTSCVSYVCQDDDALLPSLTVRETIRYAAGLKLPAWMSKQDKIKRAEKVLLKLGLRDCADNMVGNDLVKGISGGEKRRVSIACQVLTEPRVLFCDEPTSGLDSWTAASILEVLQGLAGEGRTVVITIHAPRSDLFKHFGNILLLARGGYQVYSGAARDVVSYFGDLGYQCPPHQNPADYSLDLITIDLQEEQREAESRKRVDALIASWTNTLEKNAPPVPRLSNISEEREQVQEAKGGLETAGPATESSPVERGEEARGQIDKSTARKSSSKTPVELETLVRTTSNTPAELGSLVREKNTFWHSMPILLSRASVNFRRQPPLLLARTMQVAGLGIVLALFFAPLSRDYIQVQNHLGIVQQISALYFVGMLQNVAIYPTEREVFYREDDDGVYSVEAFLATYTILEVPFEVFASFLFAILADLVIGLPRTPEMFFATAFCCFGVVSCGESFGIMFNTLFNHTGFAVNAISVCLSVAQTISGLFSINMPMVIRAFNYINPVRYSTAIMAVYSLRDLTFTCDDAHKLPNGQCIISSGQELLDTYNLNVNGPVNIGALATTVVAYRLVAWALLRLKRTKWQSVGETMRSKGGRG